MREHEHVTGGVANGAKGLRRQILLRADASNDNERATFHGVIHELMSWIPSWAIY